MSDDLKCPDCDSGLMVLFGDDGAEECLCYVAGSRASEEDGPKVTMAGVADVGCIAGGCKDRSRGGGFCWRLLVCWRRLVTGCAGGRPMPGRRCLWADSAGHVVRR